MSECALEGPHQAGCRDGKPQCYPCAMKRLAAVEQERDALRRGGDELTHALNERNVELDKAEQERDEAKTEAVSLFTSLEATVKERDKAEASCAALRAGFKKFLEGFGGIEQLNVMGDFGDVAALLSAENPGAEYAPRDLLMKVAEKVREACARVARTSSTPEVAIRSNLFDAEMVACVKECES